jgi:CRP-like cAMP-binding protein
MAAPDCFRYERLIEGEHLWLEGDYRCRLAMVLEGEVSLSKQTGYGKRQVVLGLYGVGAIIGEYALFEGRSAAETAMARGECLLLTLDRNGYQRLAEQRGDLAIPLLEQIMHRLSRRLHGANERLASLF